MAIVDKLTFNIKVNRKHSSEEGAFKTDRRDQFKARMLELSKAGPKPTKHTHQFKYTRHVKVFSGLGDNGMELQKFLQAIRKEQAAGKHYEVQIPKSFLRHDKTNPRNPWHQCFSVRYYTRQLIGPKEAVAA